MATLLIPWYRSESDRHNSELLGALMSNLAAPGVSRVLLACEGAPPPLHNDRLEIVECAARPSFWELFELVRDEGPFAVVNADCAVVDARAVAKLSGDDCLWVTRWIIHHGRHNGRYQLEGGADLFAFANVPDRLARGQWRPGEAGCDWELGRALVEAGYHPKNTPWAVPVIHFHAERIATEDSRRASLTPPGLRPFHVHPTFDTPSDLWHEPFRQYP